MTRYVSSTPYRERNGKSTIIIVFIEKTPKSKLYILRERTFFKIGTSDMKNYLLAVNVPEN